MQQSGRVFKIQALFLSILPSLTVGVIHAHLWRLTSPQRTMLEELRTKLPSGLDV